MNYSKSSFFILIALTFFCNSSIRGKVKKSNHTDSHKFKEDFISKNLNTNRNNDFKWYKMFTDLPSDYYSMFEKSFSEKDLTNVLEISILTGALATADQSGWKYQRQLFNKSNFDRNISNIAVDMGNGGYQFLTSAAFFSAGILFHNQRAIKTGSNIAEAVLSTGLFVQLLKRVTGRESPYAQSEAGGEWQFMPSIKEYQKNQPKYYSFPSGHLSTATAVVTVIANNYPNIKWIKPVGYSLLGVLSFSLINKGMHWYSDLPVAFFLGYTFGNIISPLKKENRSKKLNGSGLIVAPSYVNNGIALNAVYSF